MDNIRDQDDRDREVSDQAVCLLDQCQKPELGNAEIYDAADKRRGDLFFPDLWLLGSSCWFLLFFADPFWFFRIY